MTILLNVLFILAISFQAHSASRENSIESKRDIATEATTALGSELASSSSLSIRPRPSIPAQFNGPENNLCYNYANLLVRNGRAQSDLPPLNNQYELLSTIYQNGRIILHHTATEDGPEKLISSAIQYNGWADIGYHFLISKDGTITEGRSLFYMGANAGQIPQRDQDCSNNQYYMDRDNDFRSIGIALIGNFELRPPTEAQSQAQKQLISQLKRRFNILEIKPHKSFKQTLCPGRYLMNAFSDQFTAPSEMALLMAQNSFTLFSPSPRNRSRLICYSCQ